MTFNSSSKIFITGGTGSFGKAFIDKILKKYPDIARVVIYSRDELKQWELQERYPEHAFPQLRFFLGDIRDSERLKHALEDIDTVIHAAALKQVPAAEYNPMEFIKTNIIGAENLIRASLQTKVKRIVALSTDKAAAPINLYGATKLCSDKLFIAANNIKGSRDLRISVVRYGNVMGSRGSVIPYFIKKAKSGELPITDEKMTRFNITLDQGISMVLEALNNSKGGEIYVPKIPSYRVIDVAKAICPECSTPIKGIRPGEKIHEEMITQADSYSTYDFGKYYIIFPNNNELINIYKSKNIHMTKVAKNFSYNSGDNKDFLSVEEIKLLISKHIKIESE
tara:strand:+ start:7914 stop:8927 length:1014 start_codon:yes stop_codon:yes gene_type:complete